MLVTGFDIIFFWVARMVMMGLKFMGDVPFREVYIHGLVRDQDGQKMSKSKGNILDPIDLIDGIDLAGLIAKRTAGLMQPKDAPKIEKATRRQFPEGISAYGTDALRFTFAALATQGRDIRFDLGRIEGYRNFCNKLWNAARYVLTATAGRVHGGSIHDQDEAYELGLAERWVLTRLESATKSTLEGFEGYRFDLAAQAIYAFVWDEYCDWYLEWSKIVLQEERREPLRNGTHATLLGVLETVLRLCHPFMPFLTEELWQRVAPRLGIAGDSVMLASYPEPGGARRDREAIVAFEFLQAFVQGVRRIRAEFGLPPGKPLKVLVQQRSKLERLWLEENRSKVMAIGRIESIDPLTRSFVIAWLYAALISSSFPLRKTPTKTRATKPVGSAGKRLQSTNQHCKFGEAERWLETVDEVMRHDGRSITLPPKHERQYHRVSVSLGGRGHVPLKWGDLGNGFVHVCDEYSVGVVFGALDTITDFVEFLKVSEALVTDGVQLLFAGGGIEDLVALISHMGVHLIPAPIQMNNLTCSYCMMICGKAFLNLTNTKLFKTT